MKTLYLIFFAATVSALSQTHSQWKGFPQAKLTVQVIDEDGKPIPDVNATCIFGGQYDVQSTIVKATGHTDVAGLFTAQGYTDGMFSCMLRKDGYYGSSPAIPKYGNATNGQWLPWNPTLVTVLRPIGKPVALYAKKVQTTIPILDKPCGYDLEAGDWVTPYGKGVKKDFVFTILQKEVMDSGNFNAQGELAFANPLDGLQEASKLENGSNSAFKWERLAPENGYEPTFHLQNTWWKNLGQKPIRNFKNIDKEWEGNFFRVRTVEQVGKIVSAHYGKIRGGIEIEPRESKTCTIMFTYYFNPTPNDRNLEWDTKKNLFGGLTDMETPREP
jgi:hypothetical protein